MIKVYSEDYPSLHEEYFGVIPRNFNIQSDEIHPGAAAIQEILPSEVSNCFNFETVPSSGTDTSLIESWIIKKGNIVEFSYLLKNVSFVGFNFYYPQTDTENVGAWQAKSNNYIYVPYIKVGQILLEELYPCLPANYDNPSSIRVVDRYRICERCTNYGYNNSSDNPNTAFSRFFIDGRGGIYFSFYGQSTNVLSTCYMHTTYIAKDYNEDNVEVIE